MVRLTPGIGMRLMDTRTKTTYSEVDCKPANVKYFKDVEDHH